MLVGFEVTRQRLATRGLGFLFHRPLGGGLLGRLGALLERPPLVALDNRRRWQSRYGVTGLALLALRDGEQLADALVEARELLDQLRDLLAKRGILPSQR